MITITELNEKTAWRNSKPIQKKKDMSKRVATIPMDREWKSRLSHMKSKRPPEIVAFCKLLRSFGGEEVALSNDEPDLEAIMTRGQLWYDDNLLLKKGRRNGCHGNSSRIWEKAQKENNPNIYLATGYALSDDGMWRCHSWCVDTSNEETRIIETTVERLLYFGFVMTEEEAKQFLEENE